MNKIILGIHGLGNKPPKDLLEKWWRRSINDGIFACDHTQPDFQFELVYWSDLLHPEPLNPNLTDDHHELFLDEPYVPPAHDQHNETGTGRKKILDYLEKQMDKILLNDDYSINFSTVTDSIIHHYFSDLDCYYSDDCHVVGNSGKRARESIRTRLEDALIRHRDKEILLLSHSMGSIIAYDVLSQINSGISIDTWITAGSPLGLPVVISKIVSEQKGKLQPITQVKTPESIASNWFNFSDLEDKVAIDYALAGDYSANSKGVGVLDAVVKNQYIIHGKSNAHKSFGYFQTPELGEVIYNFLSRRKSTIWENWFNLIKSKILKNMFGRNNTKIQK
ncbi:MAG: hypothetical protein ACE5D7_00650 [Fidelibacterota bacterium]